MSFYVTLPSHANRREFPNNQANSFKIRLPKPLQLQGGGWQVGLSAISLPDTRVNLYELVKKDGSVLATSNGTSIPPRVPIDLWPRSVGDAKPHMKMERFGLGGGWGEFHESHDCPCGTTTPGNGLLNKDGVPFTIRSRQTHVRQVQVGRRGSAH